MKTLGEKTMYPQRYDAGVLDRVPRQIERTGIGLSNDSLPFTGVDVWQLYEISFLLDNGAPVAAIGKLVIPCESTYLVESKSLKLYLNSFNMEKLASTVREGLLRLKQIITKDLTRLLEIEIQVEFFTTQQTHSCFTEYDNIDQLVESLIATDAYNENPSLLNVIDKPGVEQLYSTLLKSNCKVTGQPDWGNIFIAYKAARTIEHSSLLQYLVSFREENHFHEEIVETVFKRLYDLLSPEELTVVAFYTRRGGIDINPCRTTSMKLIPSEFLNPLKQLQGHFRQ